MRKRSECEMQKMDVEFNYSLNTKLTYYWNSWLLLTITILFKMVEKFFTIGISI